MNIDEIINNTDKLLIENYFELQREAEKKYGKNTVVFIEIGSFYEIYESDSTGKASDIAKSLNILLTKKNKKNLELNEKNPFLCGIPTVSLDKHLQKLISEKKWTILLVSQKGIPPKVTRYLEKIISPGTNIDYITSDDSSYIASIYFEKNKNDIFSAGISLIDPTIGSVLIYEKYGLSNDKNVVIDEVNQILSVRNISELIITHDIDDNSFLEQVLFDNILVKKSKTVKDNFNVNYQNEVFKHIFKTMSILSPIEELNMERMPFSVISLSVLLDFIIEHNKLICKNLSIPRDIYSSRYMYLGNNPISQLDILNKNGLDVLSIINNGISSFGRRFIKEQLINPLISKEEIENRYINSLKYFNFEKTIDIEKELKTIYDLERLLRKFEIGTIQPFEVYNLYISVKAIQRIEEIDSEENISTKLLLDYFENIFDLDILSMSNLTNISKTFIKKGFSLELDSIQEKIDILLNKKTSMFVDVDYVSIKESETEGLFVDISNKKYSEDIFSDFSIIGVKNLKNSKKIFLKELTDIYDELVILKSSLIKRTVSIYSDFIKNVATEHSLTIKYFILYISNLEFYINNAKLLKNNAYCVPEIIESNENFYEVEGIRHPIVEIIEKDIFIPNNIQFGKKDKMSLDTSVLFDSDKLNGFLLYGQNSSGKTVLSKSIGISIILAQAGFFIPAKSLKFSIFNSLFTRISGQDNLLQGLSTFAVEMTELKNILNRTDSRSLVIGDEISHGTETTSGLSIVAASILELGEKDCSFVIATHLHQLQDISSVFNAKNITSAHLSLNYNEEEDILTYNRKLQKGSGSSIYGLEFAKSLKMPKSFLSKAYNIRKEIANDLTGLENLIKKKKSRYNSKLYVGICSRCGEPAEDVHHIREQQEANEFGLIDHFHKNNKANLETLCKKCHNLEHS